MMEASRKICPDCGGSNPPWETRCRSCGRDLATVQPGQGFRRTALGYEYVSPATFMGIPLVHIAYGLDADTGRIKIARGMIAIGNIAVGAVSLGGVATGLLSFGGVSLGVVVIGGFAAGALAVGGMAVGIVAAMGGLAVSLGLSVGGLALGTYTLDSRGANPALLALVERSIPLIRQWLPNLFP